MRDLDKMDECLFSIEPGQPQERMVVSILAVMRRFTEKQRWGKIWFSFYGYDRDKREIWEIDEIKEWASRLVSRLRDSSDPIALLRTVGDDAEDPGMVGRVKLLVLAGMGTATPTGGGNFRLETNDEASRLLTAVEELR